LDDLCHGNEVDIIVLADDFIHPEEEGVHEFGIVLEPGSVEEEAKRGPVLSIVPIKVVVEEGIELLSRQDVGARINHSTAWEILVELRVLTTVQLVHDQLPDSVATGRAFLKVAVATVRHTEVKGIRPERGIL